MYGSGTGPKGLRDNEFNAPSFLSCFLWTLEFFMVSCVVYVGFACLEYNVL